MKDLFICLFILMIPLNGYSCDCDFQRRSSIELFNSTDVIFQGKVVSIKNVQLEGELNKEIVFEVFNNFKGAPSKYITIYTDNSNCALGINNTGEKWIIWAYNYNGKITTNQCTASIFTDEIDNNSLEQLIDFSRTEGYKIFYNKAGEKIGEGSFLNQNADGIWMYYINNFIVSIGSYKGGFKHGEWIYYYEPVNDIQMLTPECKFTFSEIYNSNNYKSSRKINKKEKYYEGEKDGLFYYYNFDGSLYYQKEYVKGKSNGIDINYFENGLPQHLYYYKNDIANGVFMDFNVNGTFKMISYYENGQKMGDWEIFDKDGNQICKSNYKNIVYDEKTYTYHCKE